LVLNGRNNISFRIDDTMLKLFLKKSFKPVAFSVLYNFMCILEKCIREKNLEPFHPISVPLSSKLGHFSFFSKTKIQKVESIQQTLIIGIIQKITAYVRFIDKLFKAEFTGQILESHFYSLMHLKQSWVVKIFYTIKKSDSVIDICS
jgi:hypothetical protein